MSEHMATHDHKEGDIEIKILDFESNWKRRTIKEKIAINKLKPDLNGNEGHHLSAIFDLVPSKYDREARLTEQTIDDVSNNSNSGKKKPLYSASTQQLR